VNFNRLMKSRRSGNGARKVRCRMGLSARVDRGCCRQPAERHAPRTDWDWKRRHCAGRRRRSIQVDDHGQTNVAPAMPVGDVHRNPTQTKRHNTVGVLVSSPRTNVIAIREGHAVADDPIWRESRVPFLHGLIPKPRLFTHPNIGTRRILSLQAVAGGKNHSGRAEDFSERKLRKTLKGPLLGK